MGRWSRPVSRVLSRTIIPLGSPSPATSSGLPGSTRGLALPLRATSLFGLAPGGVCRAVRVATSAVRSYRTISPLPAPLLALGRFAFCCTFRRLTPPRRYLAPRPREPGLSSTLREKCSDRPADSGAHHSGMPHPSQGPGDTSAARLFRQLQRPRVGVVAPGAREPRGDRGRLAGCELGQQHGERGV